MNSLPKTTGRKRPTRKIKPEDRETSKHIPASFEKRLYTAALGALGSNRAAVIERCRKLIAASLPSDLKKSGPGTTTQKRIGNATRVGDSGTARFIVQLRTVVDERAQQVMAELDQVPADDWDISQEETYRAIEKLAIDLCESTRADIEEATLQEAESVIDRIRQQIAEGMRAGQNIEKLTSRIGQYFDSNLRWKARRIARTESTRAYNAGTVIAGEKSEIVQGWEWLLSDDACDECVAVGMKKGKPVRVSKGQAFATEVSDNPSYATVHYPPLHPNCRCTILYVLVGETDAG